METALLLAGKITELTLIVLMGMAVSIDLVFI